MSGDSVRAAVLFHRAEYHTAKNRIMGRHSANQGFIRAWARHSDCSEFYAYVPGDDDYTAFDRIIKTNVPASKQNKVSTRGIPFHQPASLADAGLLYVPDPNLAKHAFTRQFHAGAIAERSYSLCGITHTLASSAAMELIATLQTAPLRRWDALICTSTAARRSVEYLLSCYGHYLAQHFSMKPPRPALQLPVIPLGVDCEQFATGSQRASLRAKWRTQLAIGSDDVVVLYYGRLSFHAKGNPFPLYRALQVVRERSGRSIHLLMVGQAANEPIRQAFADGAASVCPDIDVHLLDGSDAMLASEIWYAADIFSSLADNIQETFGLTPIEAMAAGLPCVVSDWDGYRDTVVDGQTGFLIPTFAPAENTIGLMLAMRHAQGIDNYDHYVGNASKCVAVDIPAVVTAFEHLILNDDARQQFGERARRRAQSIYDWQHIIAAYEELWRELAELRCASSSVQRALPSANGRAVGQHPFYADPFAVFATYASQDFDSLRFTRAQPPQRHLNAWYELKMLNFGLMPERELIEAMLDTFTDTVLERATLCARLPGWHPDQVTFCLGWLLKTGLVQALPGHS